MHVLHVRNVCEALVSGLEYLTANGVEESSRNGPVLVVPSPVMTVTHRPQERVLFSAQRNANPFFHLFEAIWMLAGRNDVESLNIFVHDFGERFGEPDGRMHGAYGHRWRNAFGLDQLDFVVDKLRHDPTTRQCVLQMWHCDADLAVPNIKDRPCNTHIYLRNNDGCLDLTVCCRSNDAIWGAHGANAVHFSILQEYLAARLDLNIGLLYQLSNNYHAYIGELMKYKKVLERDDRYHSNQVRSLPMFTEPKMIDNDVFQFMRCFKVQDYSHQFANPWFSKTLAMAMSAHYAYRAKNMDQAMLFANSIEASDWRVACLEWLGRRKK